MINKKIEALALHIYKLLIPGKIRDRITMYRDAGGLNTLRRNILSYYSTIPDQDINDDQKQIINYLRNNTIKIFPYTFPEKYNTKEVKVHLDKMNGLLYVFHDKKRLYFKRRWTRSDVRNNYNNLRVEQDKQSPHRYLNDEFNVQEGSVVVDIGTAEGNFALSVIEKVSLIYLFETDKEWIEALQATFAPWSSKVKIINKYVSDHDDDYSITLNSYFANNKQIDFVKIDVDGAELELLRGLENILNQKKSLKIAICTYHKQDDEKKFTEILEDVGFEVRPSDGYMIFVYDKEFKPPYLRRGLLRAERKIAFN